MVEWKVQSVEASTHSTIGNLSRPGQRVEDDQGPNAFQDDESDLEGMQSDVSQYSGADRIEDVVQREAKIHPAHLVAAIGHENQQCLHKRHQLSWQCDIHDAYCTQAIVRKVHCEAE